MSERATILIVDDEPAILLALELAFEEAGWATVSAGTGEEALARLSTARCDAALIDKNLPGRSGIDVAREMRRRCPDLGIVLMTGYASAASERDAREAGVDAYLEKPFDNVFEVTDLVHQVMLRRRQGEAGRALGRGAR